MIDDSIVSWHVKYTVAENIGTKIIKIFVIGLWLKHIADDEWLILFQTKICLGIVAAYSANN